MSFSMRMLKNSLLSERRPCRLKINSGQLEVDCFHLLYPLGRGNSPADHCNLERWKTILATLWLEILDLPSFSVQCIALRCNGDGSFQRVTAVIQLMNNQSWFPLAGLLLGHSMGIVSTFIFYHRPLPSFETEIS